LGLTLVGFLAQELCKGAIHQLTDLTLLVELSQGM
jgi:hypothetical protein